MMKMQTVVVTGTMMMFVTPFRVDFGFVRGYAYDEVERCSSPQNVHSRSHLRHCWHRYV